MFESLTPQAKAQGEAFPFAPKWADMLDPAASLDVVSLPQPGLPNYDGSIAHRSQMVRTNGDGCVLFFAVDGRIYDHDGYLIADAEAVGCQECMIPGVMEMISIPVPGHCNLYYIFSMRSEYDPGQLFGGVYPTRAAMAILDLSLTNAYYPERKGALADLDNAPQNYGMSNVVPPNVTGGPSPWVVYLEHSGKGGSTAPMLRTIDPTGSGFLYWLYVINTSDITVYKVDGSGVVPVQYEHDFIPIKTDWDNSAVTKAFYRDAAVANGPNNEVRLAITDRGVSGWSAGDVFDPPSAVVVLRFNANTGALLGADGIQTSQGLPAYYVSGPEPNNLPAGYSGGPAGIAWLAGGTRFLLAGDVVAGGNWVHKTGVFDLTNNSWTDLTAQLGVQQPQNYFYSRFYPGTGPGNGPTAVYLPSAGGVAAILDINGTPTWNGDIGTSADIVPPTFAASEPNSYHEPRFIDAQVTNDAAHLARVNDPVCCEVWSNYLGYSGSAFTFPQAPATVDWYANNNPFGNCGEVTFLSDLIVPPGITLNIHDMTLKFAPTAHFIVRAGAFANVQWSLLTASDCLGLRWPGVRVEGDPTNATQSITLQGRFRLWHSEIEEAEVGVWCAREGDPGYFGGIVYALWSKFNDCIVGARIERFHRVNGNEQPNFSSFYETDFQTTLGWPDPNVNTPKAHIHLYDVNGVKVDRCSFTQSWGFDPHHRGVGIVALDASFRCRGYQAPDNKFQWLTAGIVNILNDPLFAGQVDGMTFDRNLVGIYDMACTYSMVTNNRFTAMTSGDQLDYLTMGMYVDQSVGYVVERNYFADIDTTGTQEVGSVGIWFHGPQPAENMIYDNEFHDLTVGNVAEHRHDGNLTINGTEMKTGLQWLCGLYEGEVFDQFLLTTDGGALDGTIKVQQGYTNADLTAGNVFVGAKDCDPPFFEPKVFADHDSSYSVTYCYYSNIDSPDSRPECVEDIDGNSITATGYYYNLLEVASAQPFDPMDNCAGGVLDMTSQDVVVVKAAYEAKQAELRSAVEAYEGLLDHGEHEDIMDAIKADPPWPSHQLRSYLLAKSPLREGTILAAVHRAEPMDPWHLTQVLIANSRLSGNIWAELDATGVLSPFFYNLVRGHDTNPSIRETLLDEINLRSYEKDQAQRLLVLALQEDSTYADKLDTLLSVLGDDTLGYGRAVAYQLALAQERAADVAVLDATLSEDKRFERLRELGALKADLGYDWTDADVNALNQLTNAAWYVEELGGAAAWGVLYALGATDSLPNGHLPMEYRSLQAGGVTNAAGAARNTVMVYPNPAQDRVMITYPTAVRTGTFEILDGHGRVKQQGSLADHSGFVELDVRSWSDGLYLARVLGSDAVVGETKFTVIR